MQNSGANQFNNILIGGSPAIFHPDCQSPREKEVVEEDEVESLAKLGIRQFMENVLFLIQLDANRGPLFCIIITIPFNASPEMVFFASSVLHLRRAKSVRLVE